MSKIIGKYLIIYPEKGMVEQKKNLISHEDYLNIIKPSFSKIISLSSEQIKFGRKNKRFLEIENEISNIKKEIKDNFGEEYFTDNSPLFNSIKNNGIMELPEWQGERIKVIIKKIS